MPPAVSNPGGSPPSFLLLYNYITQSIFFITNFEIILDPQGILEKLYFCVYLFLDGNIFLYSSFVRPDLEYENSVWSHHLRKHIKMLENVQIKGIGLNIFLKTTYVNKICFRIL